MIAPSSRICETCRGALHTFSNCTSFYHRVNRNNSRRICIDPSGIPCSLRPQSPWTSRTSPPVHHAGIFGLDLKCLLQLFTVSMFFYNFLQFCQWFPRHRPRAALHQNRCPLSTFSGEDVSRVDFLQVICYTVFCLRKKHSPCFQKTIQSFFSSKMKTHPGKRSD